MVGGGAISHIASYIDLLLWIVALAFVVVFVYEACVQKTEGRTTMASCAIASGIVMLSVSVVSGLRGIAAERKK